MIRRPRGDKPIGLSESSTGKPIGLPPREIELPIDSLDRFADAEAIAKLLELTAMARICAVEVFAFGDKPKFVVADDAVIAENLGEGADIGGVNDEELVLVELDFHRTVRGHDGEAGATVIQDEVFEVAAMAFEDRQVDRFAEEIDVTRAVGFVAGFEDNVHDIAKRVEEVEEGIEEFVARQRGGEDGNLEAGFFIAIGFDAEGFARGDGSFLPGADRVGELKVAVAVDLQMFEH